MIVLEIQLLIEKILELQKSYYHQYKNSFNIYKEEKGKVKLFNKKYLLLKK